VFLGQYSVKTILANERFTVVGVAPPGTFSSGSHTMRFGVGVDIFGDGVNNVQADFLDITVTATAKHF
jgi:hypothetical protein